MENRIRLFSLLLVLFQGCCTGAFAQYDLDRPAMKLTAEDGLPNYYFRGLVQDKYGFVWMGSYDGLSRFDGSRLEVFRYRQEDSTTLAHNAIMGLSADPVSGKVWIATYGGLSVHDPATGHFRSYYQVDGDTTSLLNNFVNWVYVDRQGDVWVASGGDVLCRYDAIVDGFSRYYPRSVPEGGQLEGEGTREKILSVCQDMGNDSLLWIGTNFRFFSFNKKTLSFDYQKPALPNVSRIFPHVDGRVYLLTSEGSLHVYDPGINKLVWEGLPGGGWKAGRVYRRSDETLWLSCDKGIAVLDVRDISFTYPWINDPGKEKKYEIDLIDDQGRIWSGSTSGVQVFDPQSAQFQNRICETPGGNQAFIPQGLAEDADREVLYLTANGGDGIYRYDLKSGAWSVIPPPADYDGKQFYGSDISMGKDGRLYVLESIEIFTLSDDGRSMVSHPVSSALPEGRVWINFLVDNRGNIWLGNKKDGVWKVNMATGEAESLEEMFPGCDLMRYRYAFYEDSRHNIWISTCSGFGFYSYEKNEYVLLPYLEEESNDNTFKRVRDFAEDSKGILWVSTETEALLGQIRVDRPEEGIFRKISFRQMVDSDSVRVVKGDEREVLDVSKIAVDPDDNIWTISSSGVLKFDPVANTIAIYNDRDGLLWKDEELNVVTVNQIEPLSSGRMGVAFRKGLSIFEPSQLRSSEEMPRPYLVDFKVFNNDFPMDSSLFLSRQISLEPDQNYFSFDFSAVGYTHPDIFRFQYRLIGVDKDWIDAGSRRYAAYTNVNGGRYTFEVRVANSDGKWNPETLKTELVVATPWYRQDWFRVTAFLLFLFAGYAFYNFRMKQVQEAERVRTEFENQLAQVELTALRAQMNPHFLFNCLNSIDYFILKNETRKASEYLQDFSRLIRLILQNSRSHYVNLKDELEALTLYVEMEKLRFSQRFDFEIEAADEVNLEDTEIPPMLIQPFVENAIWHGLMHKEGGGMVRLHLSRDGDLLKCVIEDNGIGRKRAAELKTKHQKKKSMGMNITRERINIINRLYQTDASVKITDLVDPEGQGAGTRVELSILV